MNIIRANYGRFSIAICNIHGRIPTLPVKKELNVVSDVAADNFYKSIINMLSIELMCQVFHITDDIQLLLD